METLRLNAMDPMLRWETGRRTVSEKEGGQEDRGRKEEERLDDLG